MPPQVSVISLLPPVSKFPPASHVAMSAISYSAWSPDGAKVASNGASGVIVVWDVLTGESRVFEESLYKGTVQVSWGPDSKQIVSNAGIWDISTGKLVHEFSGGNFPAWNTAQNEIALSSPNNPSVLEILDSATGRVLTNLEGHTGNITAIEWGPDGKFLATGSTDRTVIIWDVSTRSKMFTFERHTESITSVAWNPTEHEIATAGNDLTIQIWSW